MFVYYFLNFSPCLCPSSPWSHSIIQKFEHVASLKENPSPASGFGKRETCCPHHGLESMFGSPSPPPALSPHAYSALAILALGCFLTRSSMILPQGLCTCYSLCREPHSSPKLSALSPCQWCLSQPSLKLQTSFFSGTSCFLLSTLFFFKKASPPTHYIFYFFILVLFYISQFK